MFNVQCERAHEIASERTNECFVLCSCMFAIFVSRFLVSFSLHKFSFHQTGFSHWLFTKNRLLFLSCAFVNVCCYRSFGVLVLHLIFLQKSKNVRCLAFSFCNRHSNIHCAHTHKMKLKFFLLPFQENKNKVKENRKCTCTHVYTLASVQYEQCVQIQTPSQFFACCLTFFLVLILFYFACSVFFFIHSV